MREGKTALKPGTRTFTDGRGIGALPVGLHGLGAIRVLLISLVNAFVELLQILKELPLRIELVNIALGNEQTL